MQRFGRSFRLLKQSWGVLMKDKELLLLPVLSGLVILLVSASFLVPIGLLTAGEIEEDNPITWLVGLAFYIVTYTIGIYFQAAIIAGASQRMEGGDPTLGTSFAAVNKHIGRIVMWGVVTGTVGMILRSIQERSEIVGKIIIGIIGFAWTLATFFVVPVLVLEGVGVREALSRSWTLIKKTWGEAVVGGAGIGLAAFVLALPVVALCALLFYMGLAIVGIVVLALGIALLGVTMSALQGVYVAALYRYASTGETPDGFSADDVGGAFHEKRRRGA